MPKRSRDPWDTLLPAPIEVRGRTITTLSDARAYILGLRRELQAHVYWQIAAQRLWEAAEVPSPQRVEAAANAFQVAVRVTFGRAKD